MKKLCILVFVVAAWVAVAMPALADHMNPNDMQVLIDLYQSTHGDEWYKKDHWLDSLSHEWYGVTLNDEGQVVELDLFNNILSGPIPESLGNLSQLTTLNLSYNQLSGAIPESLGNLTELTRLDLSNNQLSGTIPSKLKLKDGSCTNLRNNQLTEGKVSGGCSDSLLGNPVYEAWQKHEEEEERAQAAEFDKFEFLFPLQLGLIGGYLLIMLLLDWAIG